MEQEFPSGNRGLGHLVAVLLAMHGEYVIVQDLSRSPWRVVHADGNRIVLQRHHIKQKRRDLSWDTRYIQGDL